jgi:hypothetical protein
MSYSPKFTGLTIDPHRRYRKTSRGAGRLHPLCEGLREYFVSQTRRFRKYASSDSNILTTPSRGKSIRTPEWRTHLYDYFSKHGGEEKIRILDSVDWNVSFIVAFHSLHHFICKPVMRFSRPSLGMAIRRRARLTRGYSI